MMESQIGSIAHVIQLAVAPVFLLTAIATLITALNNRLVRAVDRRRLLLDRLLDPAYAWAEAAEVELRVLARRIRAIYLAIICAVSAGLMICLVVASAFLGALLEIGLSRTVAVLFIMAMMSLIASLILFLREIYLAVASGTHFTR